MRALALALSFVVGSLLVAAAPPVKVAAGSEIGLVIDGKTTLIVTELPFKVVAPAGSKLYFWRLPATWKGVTGLADNTANVTAAPEGTAEVSVDAVGADFNIKTYKLSVNIGKVSPPVPPVPPGPDPPVPPVPPAPVTKLRVLVLYDANNVTALPAAQQSIIYGKATRDALDRATPLGPDGKTHTWRIWPKGVDTSSVAKEWQELAKRSAASLPWVIFAGDGGVAYEGALPANVTGMLDLISRYAPKSKRKAG